MTVELETDRLLLRLPRESDLDAYAAQWSDPEMTRFIGQGQPLTRAEAWKHMATILGHWQLRGYGFWFVEEKSTGRLLGRIGLWNPEGWPEFEVGWILGRDAWGHGYATEGGQAALDYAFRELGRHQVGSVIRVGNERSVKVAERLGESYHRTEHVAGFDSWIYLITRDVWLRRQTSGP